MKPHIITLTGPSCAGKSTLENRLAQLHFSKAVSTTTRPMREGEVDGRDYHFISREGFDRQLKEGRFVEHVEFGGNHYGLSVEEVESLARLGHPIVVVCEPIGQKQIVAFCKKQSWQCFSVFVNGSMRLIAERFLARFADEIAFETGTVTKIKTATYATRLREMMTTERGWTFEAQNTATYDYVINEFNKENERQVVDDLLCAFGSRLALAA